MKQFSTEQRAKKLSKESMMTTSLAAMVLCCILFVGSTFAWYTDTVSTSSTTIEAGEIKLSAIAESVRAVGVTPDNPDTADVVESAVPVDVAPGSDNTLKFFLLTGSNPTVDFSDAQNGSIFFSNPVSVSNIGSLDMKLRISAELDSEVGNPASFEICVVPASTNLSAGWDNVSTTAAALNNSQPLEITMTADAQSYMLAARLKTERAGSPISCHAELRIQAYGSYSEAWSDVLVFKADLEVPAFPSVTMLPPEEVPNEEESAEPIENPEEQTEEEPEEIIQEGPAEEIPEAPENPTDEIVEDPVTPQEQTEDQSEGSEVSETPTEEHSEETSNE